MNSPKVNQSQSIEALHEQGWSNPQISAVTPADWAKARKAPLAFASQLPAPDQKRQSIVALALTQPLHSFVKRHLACRLDIVVIGAERFVYKRTRNRHPRSSACALARTERQIELFLQLSF